METNNLKVLTLDSIATLKNLIGSGGGSSITLYNEYGTHTDGALTQQFLNNVLNNVRVQIGRDANYGPSSSTASHAIAMGQGATATGLGYATNNSIAIGYQAKAQQTAAAAGNVAVAIGSAADASSVTATGTKSVAIGARAQCNNQVDVVAIGGESQGKDNYTIALGTNAFAQGVGGIAIGESSKTPAGAGNIVIGRNALNSASFSYSVALGNNAMINRNREVSIGNPTSDSYKTRYLANVTTGVLDTDATNVSQVRSAVQGTTLYTGTASVNTLELSEAASSFAYLQVVCEYTGMGSTAISQTVAINFYPTETAKSFQVTATDITVGDTPMVTTLQDIWMLSDDGMDLDLVSSTKAEQGNGTLTTTPDTTSQFTIVKVVGFGKV